MGEQGAEKEESCLNPLPLWAIAAVAEPRVMQLSLNPLPPRATNGYSFSGP